MAICVGLYHACDAMEHLQDEVESYATDIEEELPASSCPDLQLIGMREHLIRRGGGLHYLLAYKTELVGLFADTLARMIPRRRNDFWSGAVTTYRWLSKKSCSFCGCLLLLLLFLPGSISCQRLNINMENL